MALPRRLIAASPLPSHHQNTHHSELSPTQAQVLCIDTVAQTTKLVGPNLSYLGIEKFNGGMVAGPDGFLYALHQFKHSNILRVGPALFEPVLPSSCEGVWRFHDEYDMEER